MLISCFQTKHHLVLKILLYKLKLLIIELYAYPIKIRFHTFVVLMKKCLSRHTCNICLEYARTQNNLEPSFFISYLKTYSNNENSKSGNLMMPRTMIFIIIYLSWKQYLLDYSLLYLLKLVLVKKN